MSEPLCNCLNNECHAAPGWTCRKKALTSNQCPYCGYDDGKHNVVCIAAELQRVYGLVNHWAGEEKRLRAALNGLTNEVSAMLGIARHAMTETASLTNVRCLEHWRDQGRAALSGDGSQVETKEHRLLRRIYNHPYSRAGLRVRDEYGDLAEQVRAVVDPVGTGAPVPCEHGYHGDCQHCAARSAQETESLQLTDAQNEAMDRDIMQAIKRDDAQKASCDRCEGAHATADCPRKCTCGLKGTYAETAKGHAPHCAVNGKGDGT